MQFNEALQRLFQAEFSRLFRYLDRLSGDPDLAADLAQEAFVRLHQRGQLPDRPDLWLVTVALNLFRNTRSTGARRRRLLTPARAEATVGDPGPSPIELVQAEESRVRVRMAIDQLPERDRQLLLLRAEGYSYRDLAMVLGLSQASVGTLLARAKRGFREAYGYDRDAS